MSRRFRELDDRALSTALTYTLTLALTTMVMVGLVSVTGHLVTSQHKSATSDELSVTGERLVNELASVDRMAYLNNDANISLRTNHARVVAGAQYAIELQTGGESPCQRNECIVLNTTNPDVTVTVPFTTLTPVREGKVHGGPVTVRYNSTADQIYLEEP